MINYVTNHHYVYFTLSCIHQPPSKIPFMFNKMMLINKGQFCDDEYNA